MIRLPLDFSNAKWPTWAFMCVLPVLCQSCTSFHSGIVETSRISLLTHETNRNTLVVLDIDNTLLEPTGQLGSDQWYYHLVDESISHGTPPKQASTQADHQFNQTQRNITIRSVDPETSNVLKHLQHQGTRYFALTARSPEIHDITRRQLNSIGINLLDGNFHPGRAASPDTLGNHSLYDHGTFFIGENGPSKGDALVRILALSNDRPDRVIFIDDKLKHVRSVDEALTRQHIPHLCLRFSRTDPKVNALQKELVKDAHGHA